MTTTAPHVHRTTTPPGRRPAVLEERFTSPVELTRDLQAVLVDLVALHVTIKQAHWTVTGPGFRSLHLALDDVATSAREHADLVAERLRALDAVPDGRLSTTADVTTLGELPLRELRVQEVVTLATGLLEQTVQTLRRVHDVVDAADPTSADLLHLVTADLEKHTWLVSSETQA